MKRNSLVATLALVLLLLCSGYANAGAATFSFSGYSTLTLENPPLYPKQTVETPNSSIIVLEWSYDTDKGKGNPLLSTTYNGFYNYSSKTQTRGQSLVNWFVNVAKGPAVPFTYTDESGVSRTVRILDSTLNFAQVSSRQYVGKITLSTQISPVSFVLGGYSTLTFPVAPRYPARIVEERGDVAERSAGNQTYAYDTGLSDTLYALDWQWGDGSQNAIPAATFNGNYSYSTRTQSAGQSLVNWFINVCKGKLNTFTFTDWNSTTHTVRMMNDGLDFQQLPNGMYVGTVMLREEH